MVSLLFGQEVHGGIGGKSKLVPFAETDAPVTGKLQAPAEAADPGKQVQKSELFYLASPRSLGLIGTAMVFPLMLKKASGHL